MLKCERNCCRCPERDTCADKNKQLLNKLFTRYGNTEKTSDKKIYIYERHPEMLHTAKTILNSFNSVERTLEELEKLEKEIASLDAVALVSWARVFEAVKAPGVVAHWEVQHEIDGKAYTEQRILHASVKNPGCIQFSTAHVYPDEYIPVMDSQFKNAADFFRYEAPLSAVVIVEKVA